MLGLLPYIHCIVASYTTAHDSATATATFVLQLPLNMLRMLPLTLLLLTAELQLSYREVTDPPKFRHPC